MPFAEFQNGNAGLAAPQYQRQVEESDARLRMAENEAAGSMMERAQRMLVSRQSMEIEKMRFATTQAMNSVDLRRKELELTKANNSSALDSMRLDAEKQGLEADLEQGKQTLAASASARKLIAGLPAYVAKWAEIPGDNPRALHNALETYKQLFGHVTADPKYQAQVTEIAGPAITALNARISGAMATSEANANEFAIALEDANFKISSGDPVERAAGEAAVSRIFKDPKFTAARNSVGERGKALNETVRTVMTERGKRADARAKAEAAASEKSKIPSELFTSTEKIESTYLALQDIKKSYDSDDGLHGPIVGLVRDLNPWDTDAQTLAKKVTAAVPTLARGVFGEVGVLTNEDMKLYKSLLPNNRSNEAAAKALFEFLSQKLELAYNGRMKKLTGQGYNTDGFEMRTGAAAKPAAKVGSYADYVAALKAEKAARQSAPPAR